ncbi:MAG: hypothetical protein B6D55_01620 [Candidatus Omnitrophica bacterium 4484_70.2]|nr:MAG: hypothetical protein B6D55_01620 [Candidatus Omnitrophica bacterium 4484_70.2]
MGGEFKLDRFQREAIRYARKNYSVIVSAPTGAGKTLVAEYIIEDCIKNNRGVVYTAPIKALSNQKYRDFSKKYPQKVGILTGDVGIEKDASILIMTTEIFRNDILLNPDGFKNREWVIFDEIHYLDDVERGTVWEEAIILLPKHMKMLALSATIYNIEEFAGWLRSIHNFPIKVIAEDKRPVPLHFFFQCNNQIYSSLKELKQANLLRKTERKKDSRRENVYINIKPNKIFTLINYLKEKDNLPCIYFSFSRRRCEELASEVYHYNFLQKEEKGKIVEIFGDLINKFNIQNDSHLNFLYSLIKRGIAYHHAGLLPTLKEIIERLFTTGLIKLIFTTETFALGINMPARSTVFDTLSKFYGRYHSYLKTRDFYQMAGRAGRRGIDKEGYVFSRVNPKYIDMQSLERIIYGDYEPIISQLRSCYATILNLYKLMGERLFEIYPLSFHFYQANNFQKKEVLNLLKNKLFLLKHLGYITEGEITWKGDVASRVYSFELPVGELYERKFLEELSELNLFITVCALTYEPRKGERRPRLSKGVKRLKRELDQFSKEIHRVERTFSIYPLSKKFYFHLAEVAGAWFEGTEFYNLKKFSFIDEGEIVRYFRMAIQVLRELISSPAISIRLKSKIKNCLRKVNRDVVDAEKQLRQEL